MQAARRRTISQISLHIAMAQRWFAQSRRHWLSQWRAFLKAEWAGVETVEVDPPPKAETIPTSKEIRPPVSTCTYGQHQAARRWIGCTASLLGALRQVAISSSRSGRRWLISSRLQKSVLVPMLHCQCGIDWVCSRLSANACESVSA
jgi:hypothetical protein